MRTPSYLSPTSVGLFYANRMEFYLKYLADHKCPSMAQTRPMSIGSAFDAYVKCALMERLKIPHTGEFDFETIFTKQVDADNRDWARENGKYAFDEYVRQGALTDLLKELEQASNTPRFEFTVEGLVNGVPLLGKPDLHFISKDNMHVIYDWKVNGYCSNSAVSPKPGYLKERPSNKMHKDCQPMMLGGLKINAATFFENVDSQWADQLSVYAWLLGEPVGNRFVVGIEQLVGKPGNAFLDKPILRCVSHRGRISSDYQKKLFNKIDHVWSTIKSGHIFDDLSREESNTRCLSLDEYYQAFTGDSDKDKWFTSVTRGE